MKDIINYLFIYFIGNLESGHYLFIFPPCFIKYEFLRIIKKILFSNLRIVKTQHRI